ncbi:pentatricopeptide repeat-containing 2, mitochondrial isoform X1 [Pelobates cultripes]|uniref:Pentatricopeptide repeat-containing protein 2, mitochondrial n=2 Tax=Pelobates cultripes TaxID=61616 RepID=A0AAD1W7F0_PELCU|nr:pentatricopeptide repeat-containing 2, mitochondrial isoform X1 [Pelobates cultripes]CAH2296898.1 pentatricopeptide repeat-containing 2, mitochondrial isoform X1 [Pelobates cultripes]CAH2296899.1 pentatricopeptide repeat-containing 2, mitochondrial isoform X1 [Pelobates cultripes]CAH2296900.1 pentatricopeptide repeat-containing 2, mitochondrial isoform X1 [Pelobates cultripes]CAH2296901.1 pentatricopeptide repeat-containing 2, mitochondrial isoform X1 [Pelobates cultripes]
MAVLGAGRWVLRAVSPPPAVCHQAKRYLLTEEILKLRDFQKKKLAMVYHVYGKKDLYFQSVNDKLQKNRIILRSELQTLLHLCETPADVEFAKQVIYRYHEENKNVIFGEFRFGPIFIRLCYDLDLEDAALELVKDQSLGHFFHDCTSFNILMDMLFTKGQYERAVDVLLEMRQRKIKFSKDTYILAFASCYKLNNSDSCKICSTLLDEIEMKDSWLPTQAACFAVAFALKQKQFRAAKTVYSQIRNSNGKLCKNLHLLVKLHNNELEDVLHVLEVAVAATGPVFVRKPEFSEDVMSAIEEKLKHTELERRFNQVYLDLQNSGQISVLTLDDMLCFTPHEHRQNLNLFKKRKVSSRTFRSLQSALLVE